MKEIKIPDDPLVPMPTGIVYIDSGTIIISLPPESDEQDAWLRTKRHGV